MVNVIAIDGPAGSGKSTVAKTVAAKLGYLYIDTGAMYRAITLKAVKEGVGLNDRENLIEMSGRADVKLVNSRSGQKVLLDGEDVTGEIRGLAISEKVKFLAGIGEVRASMVRLQQEMGRKSGGAVIEGRDIGTVVFPDAKHKFYLDASFDVRVKRRFEELKEKSMSHTSAEVAKDLRERDASDMTRAVGPLKRAEDAALIDTTGMTIGQVVDVILEKVRHGAVI